MKFNPQTIKKEIIALIYINLLSGKEPFEWILKFKSQGNKGVIPEESAKNFLKQNDLLLGY